MSLSKNLLIFMFAAAARFALAFPVSEAFPWDAGSARIDTGMSFEAFRDVNTSAVEMYPSDQPKQFTQGDFADLKADGSTLVYKFVAGKLGSVWLNYEQKPSLAQVQAMRTQLIDKFGTPKLLESAALDDQQRAAKILLEEFSLSPTVTIRLTATNTRIQVFLNDDKILLEAGEIPKILTFESALESVKTFIPKTQGNLTSKLIDFIALLRSKEAQRGNPQKSSPVQPPIAPPPEAVRVSADRIEGTDESSGYTPFFIYIIYLTVGGVVVVLILIILRSLMRNLKP